jgi:hypothetical protein
MERKLTYILLILFLQFSYDFILELYLKKHLKEN